MADTPEYSATLNSEIFAAENTNFRVVIVDDLQFVATADGQSRPILTILVEPSTWAWIGIKICEGILAAVGARIFAEVFGDGGISKQDLKDILNNFIYTIGTVLRKQLELDDKRKIESSAASIQTLYEMYLNSRDREFLMPLLFKVDELTHQSASLPLLTVPCFGIVGSIELSILQEMYLINKTKGNRINVEAKAGELIKQAEKIRPELEMYNKSRFSDVITGNRVIPHADPHYWRNELYYYYTLDGSRFGDFLIRQQAEAALQNHISQEFNRLEKDILFPLYPIIDKWNKIAKLSYT